MPRSRLGHLWLMLLLILLPGCKGCNQGVGTAFHRPLPKGNVILLRGTNGYGAFILRNQPVVNRLTGVLEDTVSYEWFFRPDDLGSFATNDSRVRHGIVVEQFTPGWSKPIQFQGFKVYWSANTKELGWIHYPNDYHAIDHPAGWSMCVTERTNVAGINPGDWRWHYTSRPPFSFSREWRWLQQQMGASAEK